jgi:dynein heavy chain
MTLEALIVLDVHNKETVRKMGENNVNKIQDFDWQSQLRYYFIPDNNKI